MRVLDIDLDFFLDRAPHGIHTKRGERLDPQDSTPWDMDEVIAFLEEQCGLHDRLPGQSFEEHDRAFKSWRELVAISQLETPFHVTHVDAHGDMDMGGRGYKYLMTELLFEKPEERLRPREGDDGLNPGNYLLFAIACRWISDLTYVFNPGGGSDIPGYHKQNWDWNADVIQLKAIDPEDFSVLLGSRHPEPVHLEPPVPLKEIKAVDYVAPAGFDFIFLARSPEYTPEASDAIFYEIRDRYIDQAALA
jgi:hypothetical protein